MNGFVPTPTDDQDALLCDGCGDLGRSHVNDSRRLGNTIRRRRICDECGYKWSTIEVKPERRIGFSTIDAIEQILMSARVGIAEVLAKITEEPAPQRRQYRRRKNIL